MEGVDVNRIRNENKWCYVFFLLFYNIYNIFKIIKYGYFWCIWDGNINRIWLVVLKMRLCVLGY